MRRRRLRARAVCGAPFAGDCPVRALCTCQDETIDLTLRDLTNRAFVAYGGKPLVKTGDWRQALPCSAGDRQTIVSLTHRRSNLWSEVLRYGNIHELTVNMRIANCHAALQSDPARLEALKAYDGFLKQLGDGTLGEATAQDHVRIVTLPSNILLKAPLGREPSLTDLVLCIFGELPTRIRATRPRLAAAMSRRDRMKQQVQSAADGVEHDRAYNALLAAERAVVDAVTPLVEYLTPRAIVAPLNTDVDQINAVVSDLNPAPSHHYEARSANATADDGALQLSPEDLRALKVPGIPDHDLHIKELDMVMLMRNLSPRDGKCNGTRALVVRTCRTFIEVVLIAPNTKHHLTLQTVCVIPFKDDRGWSFTLHRTQLPVRTAGALTITKSQGQTLGVLGVWLPLPCFTHGLLYVALSRVGDPEHVHVLIEAVAGVQGLAADGSTYTANVVYPEALLDAADLRCTGARQYDLGSEPYIQPSAQLASMFTNAAAPSPDVATYAERCDECADDALFASPSPDVNSTYADRCDECADDASGTGQASEILGYETPAHVRMLVDGAEVLVPRDSALARIKDGYSQAPAVEPTDQAATAEELFDIGVTAASVLQCGATAWYTGRDGRKQRCTIRAIHYDDVEPYYTIALEGTERETERARLSVEPDHLLSMSHDTVGVAEGETPSRSAGAKWKAAEPTGRDSVCKVPACGASPDRSDSEVDSLFGL